MDYSPPPQNRLNGGSSQKQREMALMGDTINALPVSKTGVRRKRGVLWLVRMFPGLIQAPDALQPSIAPNVSQDAVFCPIKCVTFPLDQLRKFRVDFALDSMCTKHLSVTPSGDPKREPSL